MFKIARAKIAMTVTLVLLVSAGVQAQVFERISLDSGLNQAHGASSVTVSKDAVSDDGRYVVFSSLADNLVAGDLNGASDVFLRDLELDSTVRISVHKDTGGDVTGSSENPAISADGRYVLFNSDAADLVAGDSNGVFDVFLFDTQTGMMERISVAADGGEPNGTSTRPSISADGRYVAFSSSASNLVSGGANTNVDIYVRDRSLATTVKVSERHDGSLTENNSWAPVISANGRHVAFVSGDNDLVPGDVTGPQDVFVRNFDTWGIERVSLSTAGVESNARNGVAVVSADASVVAWWSRADNLVAGDDNLQDDIFVRNRAAGTTTRVNVSSTGAQASGGGSWHTSITDDGRFVVFLSDASNLDDGDVNGTGDIFSHDLLTGITRLHSLTPTGQGGNAYSRSPSVSADGLYIAFESGATDLVADDDNLEQDVFLAWGPAMVLTDGFESADCSQWSAEVGACDPDGVYSSTPVVSYSCALGSVAIDVNQFTFTDHGAQISAGSSLPGILVGTPSYCSGGEFSNTLSVAGACTETYALVGSFTGAGTWTGTFSASFAGTGCGDCTNQVIQVSGTRQ